MTQRSPTADDHVARSIAYGQFIGAESACKRDLLSAYRAASELAAAASIATLAESDPQHIEDLARTARSVSALLEDVLSRLQRQQVAA
ncbi:hypothetical protein ACFZ8E_24925 [Methylobacterium sp. HMF5984]|uniref:hypothetical protein n=1 Tax=Methylobacterium sp. HMF5984 TaxID=3367370 RepID=UPI003854BC62